MLAFFFAALIVAAVPGPDNLFVLAQSATFGRKAGFFVIAGLCSGICIQTFLLVAGVSIVIVSSPIAFFALQCAGAAYLLFLAFKSFQVRASSVSVSKGLSLSYKRLFLRGVFMNLTNPKAVLFMLAFLPPAVNLNSSVPASVQMLILGVEFILSVLIIFGLVAFFAGFFNDFLGKSPKAVRNMNWFSGAVFIILAFILFFIK